MTTYHISIVVDGQDKASGPLNSVGRALGSMGNIAGGIIGANVFMGIVNGIRDMGAAALKSYADYERLGMALQTLTARQMVNSGQFLTVADAMGAASIKAEELQGWIQKLAIQSPFTSDDIAQSFRLAMAYGFTADESKRLTQAMVDFSAGSGATGESMNRIALALGQIKARGKLAGQEVMQLTEAGVGVTQILAKAFGKTTAEIQSMIEGGLVPADKAIEALTQSLEKDFGGAAKRQAGTFSGLISSLQDIKSVGLREFFAGTFQALQPYIQDVVDTLSSPAFLASLKNIGNQLGGGIKSGLEWFSKARKDVQTFFSLVNMNHGVKGFLEQFMNPEQAKTVIDVVYNIKAGLEGFGKFVEQNGPGISDTLGKIVGALSDFGGSVIKEAITWLSGAWKNISDWFVANGPNLETLVNKVGDAFSKAGEVGKSALEPVKSILDTLGLAVGTASTAVLQAANGDWKGAWETIKSGAQPVMDGVKKSLDGIGETLSKVFGKDWETVKADFEKSWKKFGDDWRENAKQFIGPIQDIITWLSKIGDTIRGLISDYQAWADKVNGTRFNIPKTFGGGNTNWNPTVPTAPPGIPAESTSGMFGGLQSQMRLPNSAQSAVMAVDNRSWNLNLTTTQSPAVVQSSFAILKVLEYGA